jgi:molybdenum cofactor cytidylyltransferase
VNPATRIGCLVLAAGLSRRFGPDNKLLALWKGKPLIGWTLQTASELAFGDVVVVRSGSGDLLDQMILDYLGFRVVDNPSPELGMSGSLRLGLQALDQLDGVLVMLADMPEIDQALLTSLIEAFDPGAYAIVPVKGDQVGNPVILGRQAIIDAQGLSGDRGARSLIQAHWADVIKVRVTSDAIFRDIDQPTDLDN